MGLTGSIDNFIGLLESPIMFPAPAQVLALKIIPHQVFSSKIATTIALIKQQPSENESVDRQT